jgi:hypothetical protein
MSALSTIIDNLSTRISGVLTGYNEFPNPYAVEDNNDLFLSKGYGIAIISDVNSNRSVCKFSEVVSIRVVISQKITATEHDVIGRRAIIKDLLEAMHSVKLSIEKEPSLSGACMRAAYTGSDFSQLGTFDGKFFIISTSFDFEYSETLN